MSKEVIMQVQSFSVDYPKAPMYVGDCSNGEPYKGGNAE